MMLRTRGLLLAVLVCAVCAGGAVVAPIALGAFGVESFFAANCKVNTCEKAASPAEEKEKAEKEGYSQAAGHPPFGITDFKLARKQIQTSPFPAAGPEGNLKELRVDVAPGVSTNPESVPKCNVAEFTGIEVEPEHHLFTAPKCPEGSIIGENLVTTVLEVASGVFADVPLKGKVYNLEQPAGMSSYFGVALEVSGFYAHTFIEGHVEWASNYHDYFEIKNITPGLLESRLIFNGDIGTGGFLTNPSHCAGPGLLTTSEWHGVSYEGESSSSSYTTPIGTEGCLGEAGFTAPPFEPGFALNPETTQSDSPDGITTEVSLPHDPSPSGIDSSQLRDATVVLPEGMTLNPSAGQGLVACTPAQFGEKTRKTMECPLESRVGTVRLIVPDLPASEPLEGNVYLGGGPTIAGPPYKLYVDAESSRFGISTRLEGTVTPNGSTGRLTASFLENPEQPFTNIKLSFGVRGQALAPIANPLTCGSALSETSFVPYTGGATKSPTSAFAVDSNGQGGACASPLPFALAQSTEGHPSGGAESTNFTLNLTRAQGQQYLSSVSANLPPGLVGKIPAVPLCPQPNATVGNCPSSSQIGVIVTKAGSGSTPASFSGPVYLTGPTEGAPYGMTMVVNAAVGPFSLGNVVARTRIEVNPFTGRVTVAGKVPTIHAGIPLRLRSLSVAINRQGFLINPTNCGKLATESTLGSTFGATQTVSTPFQTTGCSSLAFKPRFGASTGAKASRHNGASLITKLNFHPKGLEANVKSVVVRLPKALPSRISTLNQACREAVFNANPNNCPSGSKVGTARVKTPVLPAQLSGPAYFVSHGGAKFPDLDLVLSGDGVQIILVGNTNINEKTNVTTTAFAANPDVPFTGFELNLPAGPKSALGANGNLCKQSLVMPTTITAQNGKAIKQNTPIFVSGCPVVVLSRFSHNRQAVVTVRGPSAGRVSGTGTNLATRYKHPGRPQKVTLRLPIAKAVGHRAIRVRIGFIPKSKKEKSSVAYTTVVF